MNQDLNNFTKKFFTGLPVFNSIPEDTKIIFVSDFFIEDLTGGAELTSEAIIAKSKHKVVKVRSQALSEEFIKQHQDKYWILANIATMSPKCLNLFNNEKSLKFSSIEFDFKYCVYRSPLRHLLEQKRACDCHKTPYGNAVISMSEKADRVFWMSEKQRDLWFEIASNLAGDKNIIQSSTFSDDTLDKLSILRQIFKNSEEKKDKVWLIQDSTSWVKASKQTIEWAKISGLNAKIVGSIPYEQFLTELAKSYGLIFRPSECDTCPRIVIEAKLLGLELILNNNVLNKNESWFNGSIEECMEFEKDRGDFFWKNLEGFIK